MSGRRSAATEKAVELYRAFLRGYRRRPDWLKRVAFNRAVRLTGINRSTLYRALDRG